MNKQPLTQIPFFVYGTLLPNQPNFHLWGDGIVAMEDARLHNGRLHDLGNYPMLIEAGNQQVHGKLITVAADSYQKIMTQLDTLEGYNPEQPHASAYRRIEREVEGANSLPPRKSGGRLHSAWIYIGQEPYTFGMPFIESGNWTTYIANEMEHIQAWWATIDSVADLTDLNNTSRSSTSLRR